MRRSSRSTTPATESPAGRILRERGQLGTVRRADGTTRLGVVADTRTLELGERAGQAVFNAPGPGQGR